MSKNQFFTPVWAAELLYQEHFSHLTAQDCVWEPSCGPGNCLSVIPKHIPAVGTEIDEELAVRAQENTCRKVYPGDFRYVKFEELSKVTAMFGNLPFELGLFEDFMKRCENILPMGKKAGFILPAYFFQTSKTFMRFSRKWDIAHQIIPRDLFQTSGLLSKPIVFATFLRDDLPQSIGFRLHKELCDVKGLQEEFQDILINSVKQRGSVWKEVVIKVVRDSGGTVTLDQIYQRIQNRRPTENPFWKEQVRKVVQNTPFERVDTAKYKLIS